MNPAMNTIPGNKNVIFFIICYYIYYFLYFKLKTILCGKLKETSVRTLSTVNYQIKKISLFVLLFYIIWRSNPHPSFT